VDLFQGCRSCTMKTPHIFDQTSSQPAELHCKLEHWMEQTRSRRDYGPADFGSLQTEASVKLTPLAAFLIFIKKTMWPFWWYLRDSEAVKSYFYWGPSLNSSARVFFSVFFGDSGPGSQFGQVFQRVCVSPVCSTNERKHIVSNGFIHITSDLLLVAEFFRDPLFERLPLSIYTLRARCFLAGSTLLTKLHPFVGHFEHGLHYMFGHV